MCSKYLLCTTLVDVSLLYSCNDLSPSYIGLLTCVYVVLYNIPIVQFAGGNVVKVWNVIGSSKPLFSFSNHQKTITSLCFDGQTQRLLSAGLDKYVYIYHLSLHCITFLFRSEIHKNIMKKLPLKTTYKQRKYNYEYISLNYLYYTYCVCDDTEIYFSDFCIFHFNLKFEL